MCWDTVIVALVEIGGDRPKRELDWTWVLDRGSRGGRGLRGDAGHGGEGCAHRLGFVVGVLAVYVGGVPDVFAADFLGYAGIGGGGNAGMA